MKKIIYISLIIFAFGCGKDESTDPRSIQKPNYNYFPTAKGTYVEYDVNEIDVELVVARTDTFFYHIREVIDSTFLDNEGRETQLIKRYRKETGETEWLIQDVWTANRTKTTLQRVEENVRFLNLVFPVEKSEQWDGNVFNDKPAWEYKYESIAENLTLGSLTFDSVATVKQTGQVSVIGSERGEEKYAAGVGMIYKELITAELKAVLDGSGNVTGYIPEKYYSLKMTATAFGVE